MWKTVETDTVFANKTILKRKEQNMKKIMLMMAALVLLPCGYLTKAQSSTAHYDTVDGHTYTYVLKNGGATIFNPSEAYGYIPAAISPLPTGTLSIPAFLGGYPVTVIGGCAFGGAVNLTSVTIPSSVTLIQNAFNGFNGNCKNLKNITILSNAPSVIGDGAFSWCSGLTHFTIPPSATSIGVMAFYGCSGLTSVTIPSGVKSIGGCAFSFCSSLKSVTIPSGVTSIESGMFTWCLELTNVAIPSSVKSIEISAFYGCNSLTSIAIPSSVTSMAAQIFSYCDLLNEVYFDGDAPPTVDNTIDLF
jgi:hypothetical protein